MSSALARVVLGGLAAVEGAAGVARAQDRSRQYKLASQRAQQTNRPLVVVGDPDGGVWTKYLGRSYDCGSTCVDLAGCPACPTSISADITKGPISGVPTNSSVVYVSCVLEYVSDVPAAWNEILRIAGSPQNAFIVTVQPVTATSVLYPGAKWVVQYDQQTGQLSYGPVTPERKLAYGAAIIGLAAFSIF